MAEKVGDAYVELGTRNRGLETGLNRGLKRVQGFAVAASGIIASIGAGRGLSRLVGDFSDAIEITNKYNEVFSGAAQDINKVADDLAKSYGLIGSSSRKLLADTGDILVGFGFAEDAALDLAKQTNELAVDLASFTNIEGGAARASQALTKLLVGETEQAKALGIVVRQNSDEFKNSVKRLQDVEGKTLLQAKALAALEIAMKQTKKAQGDYARTQDQLANQMRLTGERMRGVREAAGGLVVQFLSVDGRVKSLNESLSVLTEKLNGITSAQIRTTREIAMFVTKLGVAYAVGVKLAPIMATLAANVVALAVHGGIAAAVGSVSLFTAAAVGIAAITKKLIEMRHATNQLLESQENLSETLKAQEEKFGTKSTEALRRMRREMQAAGLDTRTGRPVGESGGGGGGGAGQATQQAGRNFAFSSFEDAIRGIQTSLGKDDSEKEQKKQTGFLSNIDRGINAVNESIGKIAVVGA